MYFRSTARPVSLQVNKLETHYNSITPLGTRFGMLETAKKRPTQVSFLPSDPIRFLDVVEVQTAVP